MFIVLDSNIWISEKGLQSGAGSAVRLFLRQSGARLVLPEVVRLEVDRNLRKQMREWVNRIRDDHNQLLMVIGALKEIVLPSAQDIEKFVSEIFSKVGMDVIEVPFSIESARAALIRTIDKVPPNREKNQQFKDSVLWEDCLRLLKEDDVILVTNDRDFYQENKIEKGLSTSLLKETESFTHKINVFSSLSQLLTIIQEDVPFNDEQLEHDFLAKYQNSFTTTLETHEFELGRKIKLCRQLFATEDPDRIFLEFSIIFECQDVSEAARRNAFMVLKGDGMYNLETNSFEELRDLGLELRVRREDGEEEKIAGVVILVGTATIGHKTIHHSVRKRLDDVSE